MRFLATQRLTNWVKASFSRRCSNLMRRPYILGKPSILMIEPTNRCQLHCPLCLTGQGKLRRPQGKMSYNDFCKIVTEVEDAVFFLMLFFDGEPFLNDDFLRMVSFAKSMRMNVLTSTNGQHPIDLEIARAIVASGIDRIVVSMPGLTQETYASYNSGGEYEIAYKFIQLLSLAKESLHSSRPIIDVELLLMKSSEADLEGADKKVKGWGADILTLKTLFLTERTEEAAKVWLPSDPSLSRYVRNNGIVSFRTDVGPFCKRLWQIATIFWNGDMAGCCCDQNGERILGNVLTDGGVRAVWQGERAQAFREEIMNSDNRPALCANCTGGLLNFYVGDGKASFTQRIRDITRIYAMHFGRR